VLIHLTVSIRVHGQGEYLEKTKVVGTFLVR